MRAEDVLTTAIDAYDLPHRAQWHEREPVNLPQELREIIWQGVITDRTDPRSASILFDVDTGGDCPCRLELPNPFYGMVPAGGADPLGQIAFVLGTLESIADTLGIDILERKAHCPVTQQFYAAIWDQLVQMPGEQFPGIQELRSVAAGLGLSYEQLRSDLEGVEYRQAMQAQAISERSRALFREFCRPPTRGESWLVPALESSSEPLDGSSCVEDWDPDFDPRSILITDL